MDGLGLAAVITTGVIGFAGLAASIWSTKNAVRVARQGRVDERRIDACVEILKLVERRTLWFERRVVGIELADDPFEDAPKLPNPPEVGEQVIIETLLVAFGSSMLREACIGWTDAEAELDKQLGVAAWNWQQDYHGPDTPTSPGDIAALRKRLGVLKDEKRTVEIAIADEVAKIQGT